jgi:hypothetical protein
MKTVPDSVLKAADKCKHHSCLDPDKCNTHKKCEVDYASGQNILFLKDNEQNECPYRITYGDCQVCQCPVYYYLYKHSEDQSGF